MFRTLRLWWYYITGQNDKYNQLFAKNPNVIKKVYDKAIVQSGQDMQTLLDSIAEIDEIRQQREDQVKGLSNKLSHWTKVRDGAASQAKRRAEQIVADCKAKGISDSETIKKTINADVAYLKHQGAFTDASSTIKTLTPQVEEKQADLEDKIKVLATYKRRLQEAQRQVSKLQDEKHEMSAEAAIASQIEQANARLAGLTEGTANKDLAFVREAVNKAKSRARLMAELNGDDADNTDAEYKEYANQSEANSELQEMLNLDSLIGEPEEAKSPAKLPE